MPLFVRWGVNIAEWNVTKEEFDKLLENIEPTEKTRISKYLKETDRKVLLIRILYIDSNS